MSRSPKSKVQGPRSDLGRLWTLDLGPWTLLRLITWPYVRRHVLRSLLTVAGIVLGVAVLVGMHSANQSVLGAFQRTVDRIAGAAQLQVTAGEAGFDEEVLERVQSLPEVRVAVPAIEAVVDTGLKGQGNLLILGVDLTGDRSLRDYDLESGEEAVIDDPLVFLAQPDSLMVTREFAARNGLAIGSRVPMSTIEGEKQFTVRGIMKPGGMTQAFGGNLAVMDIYAAQKVFGRGRKFDRIDLAVRDGVTVADCQAALQKLLGPGFTVDPPSGRGAQFENMLRVNTVTMNVCSLFVLLIGMFIIYNSFAIAVTQRRYEIGVLRALGATRGQIRTLFLAESAVAGLLGSALGVGFGILLAQGFLGYIREVLSKFYGLGQAAGAGLEVEPKLMAAALAVGVVTSIMAAWVPARHAARVDPIVALQKGKIHAIAGKETRQRWAGALLFAAVAVVCLVFRKHDPVLYFAYGLTVLGALLLAPTLALWLTRVLRPLLRRLAPVEGTLAADSLIQAPRRTAATVAALMLSIAWVVDFAGAARSTYVQLLELMKTTLNPDLFVTTSEDIASRTFQFPASIGEGLKTLEGIADVEMVRTPRIIFRGKTVLLVSTELKASRAHRTLRSVAGDEDAMYSLAADGKGIIAAENLALMQNLRLGEMVELATPAGLLKLPIVGIIRDASDMGGTFFLDREVFKRHWNDDTANMFRVYLKPGADAARVKERILERYGSHSRLFVMSNIELRDYIMKVLNQWMALIYAQVIVAVLVAVLGIVNTLTVSITDRRRELGVLRAVGALRRQVRHTIWMEAVGIGLMGLILGVLLGAAYLYYHLKILAPDLVGLRIDYSFPLEIALALFPVILGAAFVAALWPAEAAVRAPLVEALEYE